MHTQAHISGQISGHSPNQVGLQLPHQNGSSLPPQIPNLGAVCGTYSMDPDLGAKRTFIQNKIYQKLIQQRPQIQMQPRIKDLVKRLEEYLFKAATSKEEYMDMDTFDLRFHALIRSIPPSNQIQQSPQFTPSSSVATMIPTPGMSHGESLSSNVTSSMGNSVTATCGYSTLASNTFNTGGLLSNANASTRGVEGAYFNTSDGSLSNGYQHSAPHVSVGSGGSNVVPSMVVQRVPTQMIPTPGLSNSQLSIKSESLNNGGRLSGAESTTVSQLQPNQYVSGQNSHSSSIVGDQVGVGMRSTLPQNLSSYGFPTGALNGGLGLIRNNMQLVNGPARSDSYMTTSSYGNSTKILHQQQLIPGDGFGINTADLVGSGNISCIATSAGSVLNNHNINPVSMHSSMQSKKSNSDFIASQRNLQPAKQRTNLKPQVFDSSPQMNFQPPQASQHQVQKFQQNQSLQNPLPSQQQQQFAQHQHQKKQHIQQFQQVMLKNEASNLVNRVKSEQQMESPNDNLHSHVPEQVSLSHLHDQSQQNTDAGDCSRVAKMLHRPSGTQEFSSSQNSQHIHTLHQSVESQKNFCCPSPRAETEALLQDQWHSKFEEKPHMPDHSLHEQRFQQEFRQRTRVQDEASQPHLSSEGHISRYPLTRNTVAAPHASGAASGHGAEQKILLNKQRWLLFLAHARRCLAPEGKCPEGTCILVQKLLKHMKSCSSMRQCPYPRCVPTRTLIEHHQNCREPDCLICVPVRRYLGSHKVRTYRTSDTGLLNSNNGSWEQLDRTDAVRLPSKTSPSIDGTSEDQESSVKRMKMDHSSTSFTGKVECSLVSIPTMDLPHVSRDAKNQVYLEPPVPISVKTDTEMKVEPPLSSEPGIPNTSKIKKDEAVDNFDTRLCVEPIVPFEPTGLSKQESVDVEKGIDQAHPEVKQEFANLPCEHAAATKSGKPKIQGVSLTELFTPEQIQDHITSLRQWIGQSKAKAERNQAMEHSMSENSCQLCAVEKLTFEPPPIYCMPCGARIKRNTMYYTMGAGDTRYYFCIPCYNETRGDTIEVEGTAIPKARFEKRRNDEDTEEWWVQCDKCEAWQHQICALFNGRRNDGGQAEYTCPNCYTGEVQKGERKPLPQSSVLGAKDLPRTILSDHIEQRLFRRLKEEKQERARVMGRNLAEVPGAEALVVRVVSSVDKKLEVKQRFLEIFQEENYPTEFPYKSKVILLFQKIEGVEVCLFGMYVQEFGSECQLPNQRRVYISYLDSVKYFRPEIKTVGGEALRTFVYHEILIGYLEYCKKRGFASCYIWACPPLKGEDYILYCHPEIQKTPKSDKLREWYLSMLRKAVKEDVVVDLTNLYDHFFVSIGESKAKVTAARLPYFDGDYWPGAAEEMISQFLLEEDDRKHPKKGKLKKIVTKRALKATGQNDPFGNASKDILLMQKLGQTISPMKEDFIMVHLQHPCTHCCQLMVSGIRWVCKQCKKFQLCDKCHVAEEQLDEKDRHPIHSRDKHALYPVQVTDVSADTKDTDEILESEFFDTRQAFLSLCQGNHYQYDTLRRAKHSSMMVLYHLHNPTAPAFVTPCNVCHNDIEAGHGWRCEICPDYDVCNICFQKDGGVDHPHKLTNHPSTADRDAQNKEARQKRVLQLRKMLDLLVHASECRSPHCPYPNCRKVKGLFRHGIQCKTRASGGCGLCKKMWYILQLHARACKESPCHVPRCKDLKEHLRRSQQQSDSRRRAAVMEMMRQRAAEVAGKSV